MGGALIVTDICHRPALENFDALMEYHHLLTQEHFVVCLAGSSVVDIPCHVVVSPYFRAQYPVVSTDNGRTVLLGPQYFIFRHEFVEIARRSRTIAEHPQRLLITVGGSDELHLTAKIVIALLTQPCADLKLQIVLGPGYTANLKEELNALLGQFDGEYAYLTGQFNLAEAMWQSDLAVTGDGLTKYETAVTNTPSIVISRFDSEHD